MNKAREYSSSLINELLSEITPEEMEKTRIEMEAMLNQSDQRYTASQRDFDIPEEETNNNKQVMNIQNLSQEEIKSLHTLLGKMIVEPVVKKDPLDKMIAEIMDEFNFAKVHKTMWALEWKWATAEGGIPSMDELKASAERLLRDAAEARLGRYSGEHWEMPIICGTGGFEAKAWCDEDVSKITGLDLAFIVSHWDTEID